MEVKVANKIFPSKCIVVKPAFKAMTKKKFRSESEQVDFSDPITAASTINTWCAEQTNNKIENIIQPGQCFSFLKEPISFLKRMLIYLNICNMTLRYFSDFKINQNILECLKIFQVVLRYFKWFSDTSYHFSIFLNECPLYFTSFRSIEYIK